MSSTPTVKLTPYDAFCLVLMSTINSLYFVENLFLRLTKKVRLVGRQLGRSKSLHGISKVAPEFNLGFLPSVIIFLKKKKTLFQYSRSGIRVSQRLFSSSIFALAKSRKEGLLYQAVVGYRVHLDLFRFPIILPPPHPIDSCQGYDVATLASPTRFVLGIDLSPTAVEKAHQYLQEQGMIVRLQVQLQQAMATFSLHTHAIASAIDNLHFF